MALLTESAAAYYNNERNYGNYQFISLDDIINQYMIAYVGEDKIIPKARRIDVAFHAQRALAELSFDTFKSVKTHEFTVSPTLQMILPQDYVNYTRVLWSDGGGVKHPIYPTKDTQNPFRPQTDSDGNYLFNNARQLIPSGNLLRNPEFHGGSASWTLNADVYTGQETPGVIVSPPDPITLSKSWYYDENKLISYNTGSKQAVFTTSIPIVSGHQYTVEYTISDISGSSSVRFVILDEDGNYTLGTSRSANGTYTETVTAGETLNAEPNYQNQVLGFQNSGGIGTSLNLTIDNISIVKVGNEESSKTWEKYKNPSASDSDSVKDKDAIDEDIYFRSEGRRYGIDPEHAQSNGTFYIDEASGKIHFSSNISGKDVILDYISDSLGTDGEMQVHKFAEEAMYKWISHAILSTKANIPEYIVNRYKKERFAAVRTEELTQILRGKSKWIKH